jgi:antitoxin component of MazEF toxin-antitoxin module
VNVPKKSDHELVIDEHGALRVPRNVLSQAGLEPKMRVTVRLDGKSLVLTKAEYQGNPLDGDLARKVDLDLFGKIKSQQEVERRRAEAAFEKGLREAPSDDEPPAHPFRWD